MLISCPIMLLFYAPNFTHYMYADGYYAHKFNCTVNVRKSIFPIICSRVNLHHCIVPGITTIQSTISVPSHSELLLWYMVSLLLALGAHAQRGLQYLVCVCVCVSVSSNLPSRAITRATRDTNGISMSCAVK